ncbi:hypothetical protein [Streptomyces sp. SD15]
MALDDPHTRPPEPPGADGPRTGSAAAHVPPEPVTVTVTVTRIAAPYDAS